MPVTVTYELTDLGASLCDTFRVLKPSVEDHMDDLLAHRAAHAATPDLLEGTAALAV